jgi:hypothetical protein
MNALPDHKEPSLSGMKPIERLSGDSRLEKIIPNTNASFTLGYRSLFLRKFIRGSWNFCSAKFTVARRGKVKALDAAFRDTEEWFKAGLEWASKLPQSRIYLVEDLYTLEVTHPYCGRLIRLMTQYDELFAATLFAVLCNALTEKSRAKTLSEAERRVQEIRALCEPDTSKFNGDGTRIEIALEGDGAK